MKRLFLLALLYAATSFVPVEDFDITHTALGAKRSQRHIDFYPWQATVANYTPWRMTCYVGVDLIDAGSFLLTTDADTVGVRANGRATVRGKASVPRGTVVAASEFEAECW